MQLLDHDGCFVDEAVIKPDFSSAPIAHGESGEYAVQKRVFNTSSVMGAAVGGMECVLVSVTEVRTQS